MNSVPCRTVLVMFSANLAPCFFPRRSEEEIISAIREKGFQIFVYDSDAGVHPAVLLSIVSCASAMIGPHGLRPLPSPTRSDSTEAGAGMVNMLGARPGLHVLEFHPSFPSHPSTGLAGLNMCMLYLARILGHHYTGKIPR
eukprot:125208-Hanusia_phi.AAC.5